MRGHGISDSAYALLVHARVAGVDWMISLHQTNQTAVPAEFPLAIRQARSWLQTLDVWMTDVYFLFCCSAREKIFFTF